MATPLTVNCYDKRGATADALGLGTDDGTAAADYMYRRCYGKKYATRNHTPTEKKCATHHSQNGWSGLPTAYWKSAASQINKF